MIQQLLILALIINTSSVQSFASWMTDEFCSRKLVLGEIIMNARVESSDERNIKVFRKEEEIEDNGFYIPGETLLVDLSDTSTGQYLYEVTSSNAKFENGGCDGKRIASPSKALLVLPEPGTVDATLPVTLVAGWALGHEAVKLSSTFTLRPLVTDSKAGDNSAIETTHDDHDHDTDTDHDSHVAIEEPHDLNRIENDPIKTNADIVVPNEEAPIPDADPVDEGELKFLKVKTKARSPSLSSKHIKKSKNRNAISSENVISDDKIVQSRRAHEKEKHSNSVREENIQRKFDASRTSDKSRRVHSKSNDNTKSKIRTNWRFMESQEILNGFNLRGGSKHDKKSHSWLFMSICVLCGIFIFTLILYVLRKTKLFKSLFSKNQKTNE